MASDALKRFALFGARPAFDHPLHVGTPNIGDKSRLMARIESLLARRHLTNDGPLVAELEQRVADFVGVAHCIAMTNGTVALEIATRALGMKGEVITPAMSFVATAHALQWQRITPHFCDVAPDSHNIDPTCVSRHINERTHGVLPVHLWGQPCDIEALEVIAGRHHLPLVYDASHAFGCSYKGRMIGSFGDAEVFSFHATKFLNSFEGGAVVTNNDELAQRMRLMKNFGFQGRDCVTHVGTNGKMSEISAAMGLTSLDSIDQFIEWNRLNYQAYQECLRGIPGVTLRMYPDQERANYQYIVIEVDSREAGLARDQLMEILAAENIDVRRYFYPGIHRMEPYRSMWPNAANFLPRTEQLVHRVLALPTGTAVTVEQIITITELIRRAVELAQDIRTEMTWAKLPRAEIG